MSELISIREAARRLGVSVDALRQWERDGRLTAERTEGGHRRFRVEEIERLLARRSKTGRTVPAALGASAQPVPTAAVPRGFLFPAGMHLEPFREGQLKDARVRLEIKRLRREAMEQQAEIDKRRTLAQQEEEATMRRERQRELLLELKRFGRDLVPAAIGAGGRSEITRDLEEFVTAGRFPLELPSADARVVVQARVSEALAWLEQQRAEAAAKEEQDRRRATDRMKLDWLIASGLRAARRNTMLWETVDQVRALREVEDQLREEVRPDWSYSQVDALVTEILSEFEECDEDDVAVDLEDDEEGVDVDED